MASKQEKKLLVTSKHILVVGGGSGSKFKQNLIQNFSNTWRVANIDYMNNQETQQNHILSGLNINLNISDPFITESKLDEIEEKVKKFSKHYECILCLGSESDLSEKDEGIDSQNIFQSYENLSKKNVELALLSGYLASKFLTTNGILMMKGCEKSFSGAVPQKMAHSICKNQMNFLNLSLGDRDDLDIDSYSVTLLERDPGIWEQENEGKNIVKLIRLWAEGKNRPVSGSYIKFHQQNEKLFPEYL